jgi:predicted membrane protein
MEQNEMNTDMYKHRSNRILAGLIIVGIGIVLFAEKMGVIFPAWLMTWPMLLIVIGFYVGVKHNFRNFAWVILMVVGGLFLWDEIVVGVDLKRFLFPIIIIAVGLISILRPRPSRRFRRQMWRERWDDRRNSGFEKADIVSENINPLSDDFISINSVFSGLKRTVLSKSFKGGKISCVFGGIELDLSQADIQGTVVLTFDEVFGGVKLVVPSNWTVKSNIEGVFHGVEDKRNQLIQNDPEKVLVLQGSAVFAGVEIKSY